MAAACDIGAAGGTGTIAGPAGTAIAGPAGTAICPEGAGPGLIAIGDAGTETGTAGPERGAEVGTIAGIGLAATGLTAG